MNSNRIAFPLFFLFCFSLSAQTTKAGPVVTDFGKVYRIENPDFKVEKEREYKAVIDVTGSWDEHEKRNALIETAARFLNMHAQSGVPASQLKVALVMHGGATKDIISNAAYQEKFGTDNPNLALVNSLLELDVPIIICGQSANYRGISREEFIPGVQLSLSAMTALVHLQSEGYQLIKF
ncbi:DsrE family protein [Flagellimonas flava]|uniref:Intracellular sulfur oxidation protein, DsrE/DsrF family n=1 Tax=Flagellimonas flava TaxID=570519 RepID=A0A1M5IIC1_9FLAO|nr:DsrE family protein [Allomuricauda flava]SHG27523.1 Intracellular sulfur oxidation protein, DsrE/DsrF family [Allomuricauda flava]